ncbi:MAG: UvrD-helicase domain-containing protein [Flavobacteriaceae bacterium]|nr:UvrD-helicase domain-containing protein [Flavobacteriaceae bacterium]
MSSSNTRFRVVIASAGSGKTSIIAKSYLTQLLGANNPWQFKKQLALTFTNKAVDEMKTRILDHLAEFSKGKNLDSHVAEYIYQQLDISSHQLQLKSGKILKSILKEYGAFHVITLDKFTNRIVQMFSRDLNLPQNFKIELNLKKMVNDIVERFVWEVNENEDNLVTKKFKMFCHEISSRGESWDQLEPIKRLCHELYSENDMDYIEKVKSLTERDLDAIEKTLLTKRQMIQDKMLELIQNQLFEIRLIEQNLKASQRKYFLETLDVKRRQLILNKSTKYSDFISLRSNKHLTDEFLQTKDEWDNYARKFTLYNKILKNWGPFSMLQLLAKKITEFQQTESRMLLNELNQKVGQVVKNSPTPFIYERFGEKYSHYFLDEFQDTSILQWNNLIPLIDHVLQPVDEHERDRPNYTHQPGSLILVGDPKQAIYRWRGGKSEQLLDLKTKTTEPFQMEQKVESLDTNYRSGTNIIQFNNALYEFAVELFKDHQLTSVFSQLKQKAGKKNGGYISVEIVDKDYNKNKGSHEDKTIKPLEKQTEVFSKLGLKEKLEFLSRKESDMLSHNKKIEELTPIKTLKAIFQSKIKGYSYSDIAILVRTNKQSTIMAQELSNHNIPIISEGSLKLEKAPEVLFVIDLFELMVYPDDRSVLKRIAEKLWHHDDQIKAKIDYHEFITMLIPRQSSLKLKPHDNVRSADVFFQRLKSYYHHSFSWKVFQNLNLYESVEYAIWKIDFLDYRNLALTYFQENVYEFASEKSVTVYEYLDYWHFNKSDLSFESPIEIDAIQILTIHKAKGLEFPVVILPFATNPFKLKTGVSDWAPIKDQEMDVPLEKVWIPISSDLEKFPSKAQHQKTDLWDSHQSLKGFYRRLKSDVLNEEMNNFYVATTRAIESLFIFSKSSSKRSQSLSLELLFSRFFESNEIGKSAVVSSGEDQHSLIFEMGSFQKFSHDHSKQHRQGLKQCGLKESTIELDISTSLQWMDKIAKQTDIQSKSWIQLGNQVHTIFGHIKVSSDVEYAIQVNSEFYWDNPKLEQKIRNIIEKVVNHKDLSIYFNQDPSNVICETGIIGPDSTENEHLNRIKPDRIIRFEDKTVLMDYKIKQTIRCQKELMNEDYFKQLHEYGDVLKAMYHQTIEKYLVYIDWRSSDVKIVKVD